MNIILCGQRCSGKSTLGRMLADDFGWDFVDTDRQVEMVYTQEYRTERSVQEIYASRGSAFFRRFEADVVQGLKLAHPTVVALGGGTLLSEAMRAFVPSLGTLIYLRVDDQALYERILTRGLLHGINESDLRTHIAERSRLFESLNCVAIDIGQRTIPEAFELLKMGAERNMKSTFLGANE